MPRGPLPNPQARRRNQATIAETSLPAAGRTDAAPECPLEIGEAGGRWWVWAWSTPQSTRWDAGALYFVARRAVLEDHMAALQFSDELNLADLFAVDDREAQAQVEWALGLLRRSATGEVALMKEMREIENRLGLNPKAMADLRWAIESAGSGTAETRSAGAAGAVRTLRAVESA